jgi:two-component system NtrC family sensor kinase
VPDEPASGAGLILDPAAAILIRYIAPGVLGSERLVRMGPPGNGMGNPAGTRSTMSEDQGADARSTGRTEWALHERVKELTCLYGIAQVAEQAGSDLDSVLRRIVSLLPPAWQYPEITEARIVLDGQSRETPAFRATPQMQSAEVIVAGVPRGRVEIAYREQRDPADEGPFLREERELIREVARQIGLLVERRETAREQEQLRRQLWHAERLGMIGQLAAGLAHELNEPLGSILGYAQLAQRSFGLPDQTGRDLDKIVKAALHARDVVKRLLLFARQTPARTEPVDLNQVIRESLFLLESRCRRAGVKIGLRLHEDLPAILADRSSLEQAFLNIAVNGIQAMPAGGRLTVSTAAAAPGVELVVEDTGEGMSPEVLRRCFDPFFTTKDIGQGTGMGLAVTHGIVTSLGGTIAAVSEPGKGSRFVVRLPLAPPEEARREAGS